MGASAAGNAEHRAARLLDCERGAGALGGAAGLVDGHRAQYVDRIARSALAHFYTTHPQGAAARESLNAWYDEARRATWATPADVKAQYRSASILKSGRVVFNVAGNKFRLVVAIHYNTGIVFVRFVGTHAEYDAIDANTV